MSAWGYTGSCRPEVSSNNTSLSLLEQQQQQQNAKKLRRDVACARLADQECGWPGNQFEETFPPRFNYMVDDATGFLDDEVDASVVSSSYQFGLSDVGPGMDLFDHQVPPAEPKQLDESWEAINNLDMDDIFGNNSFVQPNSLEVQSVSSSSDSGITRRGASSSSPDEKQAGVNISPVLAPHDVNSLNKPVYWLGHEQQAYHQPPIIVPSGLFSDTASLNVHHNPEQLQASMTYRPFQAGVSSQELNKPVTELAPQPFADRIERRGTNHLASTSGESSLEAAVLYQLGSTMAKLDVGTRLSIRNALYRLAKGASNRIGDGEESVSCTSNGTNHRQAKPPGSPMTCLETCTNKVDRTVAGLLFYRQEPGQQAPTGSGSVSPHSTISSNSSSWQEKNSASPTDHERVPVVIMCGNKLSLPPLYNHSTSYPELIPGKRGRRK